MRNKTARVGKLVAIWGPMFSGKTTWLINKFGNGTGSVVFKPDLDARYTKKPVVISHDRIEIPAVLVNHRVPDEMLMMLDGVERVLIDEINFFSLSIIKTIKKILKQGINVYVAGLVLDSENVVWGPMQKIIRLADKSVELFAKCDGNVKKCSHKATMSYRKIPKKERVRVAGADEYGACCKEHYKVLHRAYKKVVE